MELKDVYAARERIKNYLPETPLIESFHLKKQTGKNVWLKLETQLPTGTFKPRPAFNSILSQLEVAREKGVVTSSSGNFAQGAAYAARELGVNIIVVMTSDASPFKIERTKKLGAEVVLCGNSHEERLQITLQIQKESNRLLIHPYDSYETIAGDGTISLELEEQLGSRLNDDMSILVPVSGGGLIAGIAFTLKKLNYACKIIGIQPQANTSLVESIKQGHCVTTVPGKTIADALKSSSPGVIDFSIIKDYVDDVLLVDEESIRAATQFFLDQHKLVVEPSGATPVAALFSKTISSKNIICITSGGNMKVDDGL